MFICPECNYGKGLSYITREKPAGADPGEQDFRFGKGWLCQNGGFGSGIVCPGEGLYTGRNIVFYRAGQ